MILFVLKCCSVCCVCVMLTDARTDVAKYCRILRRLSSSVNLSKLHSLSLPLLFSQQVLQSVQRDAYDNLSHHWQDMAVDTMCALINDNQRMREKCDEFGEHVLRFVEEGRKEILFLWFLNMVCGFLYVCVSFSL